MGYYIEGPRVGKVEFLKTEHGATPNTADLGDPLPEDKALICVVSNGHFEAAALIYSKDELRAFTMPSDRRPKTFLLMDKETAYRMSGYRE